MRNQQNVKVRVNSSFETICPFPVGYVYMSSNSTSPANIYGGTWSAISGGRYMRAAAAWGNGGSNTITINQMPSHNHGQTRFYVYDKGGWSSPINGNAVPQVASNVTSTPFATSTSLDNVKNTGGGQRSILRTKTFGRGTELPKEGDASCVTFNKFKSVLRAASRKFAHFPLVTFICQPMVQVQQALTEARGRLSQIVGSCGQAVHGTLQAVSQHINLLLTRCQHILTILKHKVRLWLVGLQDMLMLVILRVGGVAESRQQEAMLHTTICRPTVPATLGIAQLNLGGAC